MKTTYVQEASLADDLLQQMIGEIQDYAIIFLNTQGDIKSWNTGAERIKGYTAQEIIDQNFRNFYTEADREGGKHTYLLELARLHGRSEDEGWRVRKDGSNFWASVTITAIHNERGDVLGFNKVTRDLTERKAAEDAKELHLQQLEIKNKELEQFAYIASHDLQEPLQTVNSYSNLLSTYYQDQFDDVGQKSIQFISQATERMSQLIKGLLDYSRLGRNIQIGQISLHEMTSKVLKDLEASIVDTQAEIRVVTDLPIISGYKIELRLLFQNLISNAIKFSKKDHPPIIEISAETLDDSWLLSFKDNGIGILEEHQERIFIIFQRLNGREDYEGTGIGLAHCRKIAELHNGKIWFESQPGEGSTFFVSIPKLN